MADDEVVLEPERVLEPEPEEVEKKAVTPEEGMALLQAKLDEEKTARAQDQAARQDAERRAQASAARETNARTETQESNLALMTTAIETVKQTQGVLKSNYAAAAAAGDWDAAADAQADMATSAAKLLALEQGKTQLEEAAKNPRPQVHEITDPVEALAVQLSPRSAQWVRTHPDFARDPRLNQRMLAAHNLAVTDGLAVDTDGYFAAIETTLGVRKPVDDSPLSEAAERRDVAPPAAPVRRDLNGTGMRLTAEDREMAALNKMTDNEWANEKAKIEKERRH